MSGAATARVGRNTLFRPGGAGGEPNYIWGTDDHFKIYCSLVVKMTWVNVVFNRRYLVEVPKVRAQNDILVLFRQLCGFSLANFPALIFSLLSARRAWNRLIIVRPLPPFYENTSPRNCVCYVVVDIDPPHSF